MRDPQAPAPWRVRLHPARRSTPASGVGMRELEIARRRCPHGRRGAVAEFAFDRALHRPGRRHLGTRWSWRIGSPGCGGGCWPGRWRWEGAADRPSHHEPPAGGRRPSIGPCTSWPRGARMRRSTGGSRRPAGSNDPVETERRRAEAAEKRHVKVHLGAMTMTAGPITAMAGARRSRSRTTSPPRPRGWTWRSCRCVGRWSWGCSAAGTAMRVRRGQRRG